MSVSNEERIEYIDILRGLCMVLIVWYHTNHPSVLDYPFYNSTLFFVSGMLFKQQALEPFITKKFWRLFVPFTFFYLTYYLFLICVNLAKYGSVNPYILGSIFDVFRWYKDTAGYTCNYPLWFIWTLFWLQLAATFIVRYVKNPVLQFVIALSLSILGYLYIQHIPTPFIIGRSLSFLVYYVSGYLFHSLIGNKYSNTVLTVLSILLWVCSHYIRIYASSQFISTSFFCLEFLAVASFLLQVSKLIQLTPFGKFFAFWGVNSLIVFGMHDMYLSIIRIITTNFCGEMNIWLGLMNWIVALILLIPTILILNKFFPVLVGKKNNNFPSSL